MSTELLGHRKSVANHAILIISATEKLRASLEKSLTGLNYDLLSASNDSKALETVAERRPVLILVDRETHQWQTLRQHDVLQGIPVVTVQTTQSDSQEETCISELDEGLDACWCDQTHRQIVAHIRSFLRRHLSSSSEPLTLKAGKLHMDIGRHEVRVDQKAVELTPREFQILRQFMEAPGLVLSRQELLNRVWGVDYALEEHALDVHIHSLRHKVEPEPSKPTYILTIRGVGYKLQTA
jgi:two-component system, OmpR family, response regulator RegX3